MIRAVVVWGNWGPYHHARIREARKQMSLAGVRLVGVELFARSGVYEWDQQIDPDVVRFDIAGSESTFPAIPIATRVLPWLWKFRPRVVFLPAYWHWSLLLNLACRAMGARIVLMGETHAGTVRPAGAVKYRVRRSVIRHFAAALVSGEPQRAFYHSQGLPANRIFQGYSAVDNDYFSVAARDARSNADRERRRLGLPERYALAVSRFVPKKNLGTLIEAFRLAANESEAVRHLVLAGSGIQESELKAACARHGLRVVDDENPDDLEDARTPTVHFRGFVQIDELPSFYGLASCFVLPSITEEWGLVVNEAMACGLPVVVSRAAGCARNLVHDGRNGFTFDPLSAESLATCLVACLADSQFAERAGRESSRLIQAFSCEAFADAAVAATRCAISR